jgi:four helix bundle suffix protein
LRQRSLPLWTRDDPRRDDLIARRCTTADEVAHWVQSQRNNPSTSSTKSRSSTKSTPSTRSTFPELAANAALVLIAVACSLLDRQLAAQAAAFKREGGFTERLYRVRKNTRGRNY